MDEVDFTILAATSVFTDLIEKCPPAEACRDAFDRTAKATIKMANSTGGFGQVLPSKGTKRRNSRSGGGSLDDRLNWSSRASDARSSSSNRSYPHHQQRMSTDYPPQRKPAQYDMASDAYSTSAASPSQQHAGGPHHHQKPPKRFRPSANLSDTSDNQTFNPSLRHAPPHPHSAGTASTSPLSPDPALDPSSHTTPPSLPVGFFPPGGAGAALPFSANNIQGLDFLQNLNNQGGAAGSSADFDGEFGGNQGDTQMDLNFGLGWEGLHHDFSDGQQLDLFDGFFFGDQRGAGGGNGLGLSMAIDGAGQMKMEGEGSNGEGRGQ